MRCLFPHRIVLVDDYRSCLQRSCKVTISLASVIPLIGGHQTDSDLGPDTSTRSSTRQVKLYREAIAVPLLPTLTDVDFGNPMKNSALSYLALFSLILGIAAFLAIRLMFQPREESQKEDNGETIWTIDRLRTQAAIWSVFTWLQAFIGTISVTRVGVEGKVEIVDFERQHSGANSAEAISYVAGIAID